QLASSNPITDALRGSVMHFASPVKADDKVGDDQRHVEVLVRSSKDAWRSASSDVQPHFEKYGERGFPSEKDAPKDKQGSQVLAAAVTGGFATAFAKPTAAKPDAAPLIEHSPPDARVVIFGSSAFVSDVTLAVSQQLGSELASSNVELVHNAVDWVLADTD